MKQEFDALENLWFLTFTEDKKMGYQGKILSRLENGSYLVQLYEWLMGTASCMKIMPLKEFLDAELYINNEALLRAIKKRGLE